MDEILSVRYFIICDELEVNDSGSITTASHVYDYFVSRDYPCKMKLCGVVGVSFLQPKVEYRFGVRVVQDDKEIGRFDYKPCWVDKPNAFVNFGLNTEDFAIEREGIVRFDIYMNEQVINQQFVRAVKEGASN